MPSLRDRGNIFQNYHVESPIATELRRLYSNLRRESKAHNLKSFLITSSRRGEGKSTITAYLAVTIAQFSHRKVLVVDADLRRPKVHSIFGLKNTGGLLECLMGAEEPLSAIKKTELENLDVITAGGATKEPSRYLESEMLSELFEKVKFYYDIVLIDSAPVLAVSDTLFLGAESDAVLLVVLAGVTPAEVVARARDTLVDANMNVIGALVNNVSEVLPYYYDYKYYGAYKDLK
jgi:protein-tyrosine kinase